MKIRNKYLVYLSLAFLAVALYKADYLKVPQISSYSFFMASFLFLFGGFISSAVSWKQIVKKSDYRVVLSECLAGMGLSVFGKYIPGKIWTIVGRAAYIAEKNHYPLVKLSAISLDAQFIELWFGLILGAIGLFLLGGLYLWGWLILFLWLGLTMAIFNAVVRRSAERLVKALLRKTVQLPKVTPNYVFAVMPWFVAKWVFWSIGFYMLVTSLTTTDIPWSVGLGFPLSATLGIMAFIVPGGLGVREGVMVGYLHFAGLPVTEAVTIAGTSRLWFLVGEVFSFSVGWTSNRILGPPKDNLSGSVVK